MVRVVFLGFVAWISALPLRAEAHDVRGTAVFLDVGRSVVDIELQIPVAQLELALQHRLAAEPLAEITDYLGCHVGAASRAGEPFALEIRSASVRRVGDGDVLFVLGSLRPPAGAPARWLELRFDAVVHRVVTHNVYVFVRRDLEASVLGDKPELAGLMHYQKTALVVDRTGGTVWRGLRAVFVLGVRHIAEGTDHLLFLLMLLLPAVLVPGATRWSDAGGARRSLEKTIQIVTAFTVGHALTLVLAATRGVELPARPVEILIAVSILVSAVHALRPIFAGREMWVAGGFGLVHGLAFASVLLGFGFDGWTLGLGVLGFNLGVETMQLVVVTLTMPWLILLARSDAYRVVRTGGALFGAVAASGWIAERALGLATPIPGIVEAVAAHATWIVVALALLAVAVRSPLARAEEC